MKYIKFVIYFKNPCLCSIVQNAKSTFVVIIVAIISSNNRQNVCEKVQIHKFGLLQWKHYCLSWAQLCTRLSVHPSQLTTIFTANAIVRSATSTLRVAVEAELSQGKITWSDKKS